MCNLQSTCILYRLIIIIIKPIVLKSLPYRQQSKKESYYIALTKPTERQVSRYPNQNLREICYPELNEAYNEPITKDWIECVMCFS